MKRNGIDISPSPYLVFVNNEFDLPTASGGIITLLDNITYFFSVNYTNYDYYDTVICIIFFSDYSNNYIIPLILFALLFIKYYLHSGNTGNRIIAVIRKRNLIAII